jgi:hypothetical protein
MNHTRVLIDVASRKFSFGFVPNFGTKFSFDNVDAGGEVYLRHFCEEALKIASASETWPNATDLDSLVTEFPVLFSSNFCDGCVPLVRLSFQTLLPSVHRHIGSPRPNWKSLRK